MIDMTPDGFGIAVSIPSEHGLVHGELTLQPGAAGLVVLAHAAMALDARENILAGIFRRAGLSTLSINLLSQHEERFADAHNNIPLLAKRLLDFLGLLKNRMRLGELESQPLGLYAANATSPVAVRVAALRDHDIDAVVCRGGLIDLAGMLYLRSLESPLLLLVEETDEQRIISSRRALQHVSGLSELRLIPEVTNDFSSTGGFEVAAREAQRWFVTHLKLAPRPSP
jgi:hypothetical protein